MNAAIVDHMASATVFVKCFCKQSILLITTRKKTACVHIKDVENKRPFDF